MTSCHTCHSNLDDEGTGDVEPPTVVDDLSFCRSCALEYVEKTHGAEMDAWAADNVKVTGQLDEYDPDVHFAPTREEYDMGMREAHTPNAVAAHNRHNRTNYDELIRDLDRDDPFDRALYRAIRRRVEALVGSIDELSEF